jgi:PhzF family phenazine biosynthesis protein
MSSLKKITVHIISGFTDNGGGGNPAGVVLDADGLSGDEKQAIASKAGMSETAFVSHSSVADFKLDFFTPVKQIPHCGHATIATFSYLQQSGRLSNNESSKETIDGIRKIVLRDDLAFMEQLAPKYFSVQNEMENILSSLGLQPGNLIDEAEPFIVNTGNSFLIIGLKEFETLKNLQPDFDLISKISEPHNLIGFYVFTKETIVTGRDTSARMFGPYYGIPEESATGMAAGPLACYLYDRMGIKKQQLKIEQGQFMRPPSPSLIIVDLVLEKGKIKSLMAGGKGKLIKSLPIGF